GHDHMVTQALVETAQELIAPVGQAGSAAETMEDAGELYGDIAATHDEAALGQLLEVEHLIGADDVFPARELWNERPAAGGKQDAFGREGLLAHRNGMGIHQRGSTVDQGYPGGRQQVMVDAVEPGDFGVLVIQQTLPGKARFWEIPAVAAGIDRKSVV